MLKFEICPWGMLRREIKGLFGALFVCHFYLSFSDVSIEALPPFVRKEVSNKRICKGDYTAQGLT